MSGYEVIGITIPAGSSWISRRVPVGRAITSVVYSNVPNTGAFRLMPPRDSTLGHDNLGIEQTGVLFNKVSIEPDSSDDYDAYVITADAPCPGPHGHIIKRLSDFVGALPPEDRRPIVDIDVGYAVPDPVPWESWPSPYVLGWIEEMGADANDGYFIADRSGSSDHVVRIVAVGADEPDAEALQDLALEAFGDAYSVSNVTEPFDLSGGSFGGSWYGGSFVVTFDPDYEPEEEPEPEVEPISGDFTATVQQGPMVLTLPVHLQQLTD